MTYNRPPARPGVQNYPPPPSLPPGYLNQGYFDKDGNILQELLIQWPQHLAQALSTTSRPQLKNAQLRQFFKVVREQEARLASGVPFAAIKTEILKLDALAASRLKRNNAPLLFKQSIEKNIIHASKDERNLRAFVTHFECIVGYYPDTK